MTRASPNNSLPTESRIATVILFSFYPLLTNFFLSLFISTLFFRPVMTRGCTRSGRQFAVQEPARLPELEPEEEEQVEEMGEETNSGSVAPVVSNLHNAILTQLENLEGFQEMVAVRRAYRTGANQMSEQEWKKHAMPFYKEARKLGLENTHISGCLTLFGFDTIPELQVFNERYPTFFSTTLYNYINLGEALKKGFPEISDIVSSLMATNGTDGKPMIKNSKHRLHITITNIQAEICVRLKHDWDPNSPLLKHLGEDQREELRRHHRVEDDVQDASDDDIEPLADNDPAPVPAAPVPATVTAPAPAPARPEANAPTLQVPTQQDIVVEDAEEDDVDNFLDEEDDNTIDPTSTHAANPHVPTQEDRAQQQQVTEQAIVPYVRREHPPVVIAQDQQAQDQQVTEQAIVPYVCPPYPSVQIDQDQRVTYVHHPHPPVELPRTNE